jgi:hypothetical protein
MLMQTSVNVKILEMRRKNKRLEGEGSVLLNYADSKRKGTLWLSPASCVFTNTENEEM